MQSGCTLLCCFAGVNVMTTQMKVSLGTSIKIQPYKYLEKQ